MLIFFVLPSVAQNRIDRDSLPDYAGLGMITAYDTLLAPMPLDSLPNAFFNFETIVTCSWTRPAFIDNYYLTWVDGERMVFLKRFERSKSKRFGRGYILYHQLLYDDYGNFIGETPAFLIKHHPKFVDTNEIRKQELQQLLTRADDYKAYQQLTTNPSKSWHNLEIILNGKTYEFDSCQYEYQLKLNADLSFSQSYGGNTECYTAEMSHESGAGVEGSMEYAYTLQTCRIDHPEGIWTIVGNTLILKTKWGVPFVSLQIKIRDDGTLVLTHQDGQVNKLKRIDD